MGKLSAVTLALLQEQFLHETANSLRYIARSSRARFLGLEATADFFLQEAKGEQEHADIVRGWIEDRNEQVVPMPMSFTDPSLSDADFASLFTSAMDVELDTTERLNRIYESALNERDYQLVTQVSKLVAEQIEEENLYQTILDRIQSRGLDAASVHDVDIWIGERFVK